MASSDKTNHFKVGLALGSGIARGFAHIGVLKVFKREGIKPDIMAGTSMGAVIAGFYMADRLEEYEEWALSLNKNKIFSYLDFSLRSSGLITGRRLSKMLEDYLGNINIEDLPMPLTLIGADIASGHEIWLQKGSLIDAMRASYALPGILPPVEIDGRLIVDGALVNPLPIAPCNAAGSRMTIAVDLHGDMIGKARKSDAAYQKALGFDAMTEIDKTGNRSYRKTGFFGQFSLARRLLSREGDQPSVFGVMVSSLSILQDRLTRSRIAGDPPDVHIKPEIGHIGMMEFERAEDLIRAGESAAIRAIPQIHAALSILKNR